MKRITLRRVARRFWEVAGGVSVRTKIFGIVLGSAIALSLGFILQTGRTLRHALEQKTQEQGVSIAHDLAARATDIILVNDLYALHQLLAEAQHSFSDVRYAFVVDPDGYVLAHTFGDGFPVDLLPLNSVEPEAHHHLVEIQTNEGLVWDVAVPVFGGKAGTARVGISDSSMRATLGRLMTQLGLTILVVLAGSLLAATFLTWLLTRPILDLVEATEAVAAGDFSARVARWADDEIGDLAVAFNRMAAELGRVDELRREREALRRQLLEGVISVQEEERRRISRELHDSTSQSLTSLIVGLRVLENAADVETMRAQARRIRAVARQTLEDVHNLAVQLRPAVLDDLGLVSALRRHAEEYRQQFDIPVDLQVVGVTEADLPPEVSTALYRIVQEALVNIARYAQAQHVSVLLEQRNGQVTAIIEDDGAGFDAEKTLKVGLRQKKLGLYGMRERAQLLGGTLVVESHPGQGTTLYVRIPLEKNGS